MDFDQLTIIIDGAYQGSQFLLETASLESDDINQLGNAYFPLINAATTLRLNNPNPPVSENQVITVVGTGLDLPFTGMEVTLTFFLDAAVAEMTLVAKGNTSWNLAVGFPPFSDSILAQVRFLAGPDSPTLSLASLGAVQNAPVAMQFSGNMDMQSLAGGFPALMGDSTAVNGPIQMDKNATLIASMDIEGTGTESANLGFIEVNPLWIRLSFDQSHNLLVGESPENQAENSAPGTPEPSEVINSTIALPYVSMSTPLKLGETLIPVEAIIRDTTGTIRFETRVQDLANRSIEAVKEFFHIQDFSSYLPAGLQGQDIIQIPGFYFDFDPSNPDVTVISNLGITIINTAPWQLATLPSGLTLSLDQVKLNLNLYDPLGKQAGSMSVEGEINLSETGSMVIGGVYPDWEIYGYLPNDSVWTFDQLIAGLLGGPSGVPTLAVNRFNFDLSEHGYQFEFEILLDWWIIQDILEVTRMHFQMSVDENGDLVADVSGVFDLDGLVVEVDAAYPGQEGGWTFTGQSIQDSQLSLSDLATSILNVFKVEADLPEYLQTLLIRDVFVSFNSKTKDFSFHCGVSMVYQGTTIDLVVEMSVNRQNDGKYSFLLGGVLTLGTDAGGDSVQFDLYFSSSATLTGFVGAYRNLNGSEINLGSLVSTLTDNQGLLQVTENVNFILKDGLVALIQKGEKWEFLFAFDWGFGVNISNMPLIGKYLDANETVDLAFQVTVASSGDFKPALLSQITQLLPPDTIQFPNGKTISEGLGITTTMRFGADPKPVELPIEINSDTGELVENNALPYSTEPIWFNMQKEFGPVHISRVGLLYKDNFLLFFLDANMKTSGLSFNLDGLYFGTMLTDFTKVKFGLNGLAVDMKQGGVELAGMLLREQVNVAGEGLVDQYSGGMVIGAGDLRLGALGSYAMTHSPSFFAFGALNVPIGGPPWLMVEGISAGFGYNRSLTIPSLDKIMDFPLVAVAMGNQSPDWQEVMKNITPSLGVNIGEYWAAAGISFTSFKIINGFVLASVAIGNTFEINLIGIATVLVPPDAGTGVEPLAEFQLAVRASYNFDDGFLGIQAQLTRNSFIFSRDVRLTGGFAFSSWTKGTNAGDFVLSVGGYHPSFQKPAHYPTVPALGMNWKINKYLTIKGSLYYALTGSAMMAGGALEATWKEDNLQAWFNVSLNFLMGWLPYHYEADASVTVGISYTLDTYFGKKNFSAEVNATLKTWGPEFSGYAEIKVKFISFKINFGKDKKPSIPTVPWTDFVQNYIPTSPLSITATEGVQTQQSTGNWLVNPTQVAFRIDTQIPVTAANYESQKNHFTPISNLGNIAAVGVSPMNLAAGKVTSKVNITLLRGSAEYIQTFEYLPIFKKMPAAMWDGKKVRSLKDKQMVEHCLAGFTLRPAVKSTTGKNFVIAKTKLQSDTQPYPAQQPYGFSTQDQLTFDANPTVKKINDTIVDNQVASARADLFASLGLTTEINLTDHQGNQYLACPQILTSGYHE